jgi:hypothetical protein
MLKTTVIRLCDQTSKEVFSFICPKIGSYGTRVETANVGKIFIMQSGEEKKKNVSTNLLQCGGRVLLEVSKWVLVVGWKNTEHSLGGGRRYLCSM